MGKEHLSYCKATCALLRGLCWLLHRDPWCYGLISFLNLQGKRGQAQELWQALTDTLQPEMCWLHRNFPKTAGSFISIACANASGNSEGTSRTLGLWALSGWGLGQPRGCAARPYAARGRRSLGTALPAASGVGTQKVTAQPPVRLPSRLSSCDGKWLSGGKQQELQMCLPHHNTSLCICRFQSRPLPH